MVVLIVVPLKETLAPGSGIFDAAKFIRKRWSGLQRFELALGIRIVIANVWAIQRLRDTQIGH